MPENKETPKVSPFMDTLRRLDRERQEAAALAELAAEHAEPDLPSFDMLDDIMTVLTDDYSRGCIEASSNPGSYINPPRTPEAEAANQRLRYVDHRIVLMAYIVMDNRKADERRRQGNI